MNAKKVESSCGDALSSLPDEILDQILPLLPIKRAASTSILSKRWRNLFALMISSQNHLEFDDSDVLYPSEGNNNNSRDQYVQDSFRAFVDSTLSLQQDGPLNKLSLKCQDDFDHFISHTNRWISNALERGVSDLDLRITMPLISDDTKLEDLGCFLPHILFTSNTLVKLTLGTRICIGEEPRGKICLPVLKSLFLYTVWFAHSDVSDFIIHSCPVLEELYVQHSYIDHPWWAGPQDFCHPNVKRITIHLDYGHACPPSRTIRQLLFHTPNLVYLDYSDRVSDVDYYMCNFIDSLLEARLHLSEPYEFTSYEDNMKIIYWICNVQILHLSSTTVKMMCHCLDYSRNGFPMFKNLAKLSFESKTKRGWKVLWTLIQNSPKLETLILKRFQCVSDCGFSIDGNVVKVLELYGLRGNRREVEQVKRFLWESEFLQVMKVEFGAKVDDDKKLQLTKDVLAFPRRSPKCQIHFL